MTALHNHFFWDTPKVMFMHIGGTSDEAALASAVGKVFARIGFRVEDFPYYSPEDLQRAFAGLVENPGTFLWKGIEVFWGTKP